MKCIKCGNARMRRANEKYRIGVGKILFVSELPAMGCSKCGEFYIEQKEIVRFERKVARHLAERGPATGETFRFMRKAIGMPAREVAELLSTTPETISRWEKGTRPVDGWAWMTLGSLVLDELKGRRAVRARLQALKAKPPAKQKSVEVTLEAS